MKRRLKGLGLAMLVVFAMGSVAAQGAQAADGLATAESYPATFIGTPLQTTLFALTGFGLTTECEITKFAGSLSSPGSSTVTVTPSFEKCKAFGLTATVDIEGCDFVIHIGETLTVGGNYGGTLDIECPGSNAIKVTAGIVGNKCELQIGTQTGLKSGEGFNTAGSPKDGDIILNGTGLTYKVSKDEGTCPLSKVGQTFHDGDYTGKGTVSSAVGLFVSD